MRWLSPLPYTVCKVASRLPLRMWGSVRVVIDLFYSLSQASPTLGAATSLPGRRRRIAPVDDNHYPSGFGILCPGEVCHQVPGSMDISPNQIQTIRVSDLDCHSKIQFRMKSLDTRDAGAHSPTGKSTDCARNGAAAKICFLGIGRRQVGNAS